VHGEGRQTRSLCYVDDLIEGPWRLLGWDLDAPVNLGNPKRGECARVGRAGDPRGGLALDREAGSLRGGVPTGPRGHAPARSRHLQDPRARRVEPRHLLDDIIGKVVSHARLSGPLMEGLRGHAMVETPADRPASRRRTEDPSGWIGEICRAARGVAG
jgi:hypothetical protein